MSPYQVPSARPAPQLPDYLATSVPRARFLRNRQENNRWGRKSRRRFIRASHSVQRLAEIVCVRKRQTKASSPGRRRRGLVQLGTASQWNLAA